MTEAKQPHPESMPEVLPFEGEDSFTFNLRANANAVKEIESEISQLEDRIQRLTRRPETHISGMPILSHLVGLTQDAAELRNLGKALIRVAELTPKLQELYKRKSIIELAKEDPRWLMATFADFSQEVNELVGEETFEEARKEKN